MSAINRQVGFVYVAPFIQIARDSFPSSQKHRSPLRSMRPGQLIDKEECVERGRRCD